MTFNSTLNTINAFLPPPPTVDKVPAPLRSNPGSATVSIITKNVEVPDRFRDLTYTNVPLERMLSLTKTLMFQSFIYIGKQPQYFGHI